MTSETRIHCWIISVPESTECAAHASRRPGRTTDPFICGLIARLQAEVRADRKCRSASRRLMATPDRFTCLLPNEKAEAEITWRDWPLDFSEPDFDAWERGVAPPGGRWNLSR